MVVQGKKDGGMEMGEGQAWKDLTVLPRRKLTVLASIHTLFYTSVSVGLILTPKQRLNPPTSDLRSCEDQQKNIKMNTVVLTT